MIVRNISLEPGHRQFELSAEVIFEKQSNQSRRLWYRVPNEYEIFISKNGNPFLAALLLPSMVYGERLQIEAPVSQRLLEATARIQDIFCKWVCNTTRVKLEVPEVIADTSEAGSGIASFFSGGVDSFYTLLKNQDLYPTGPEAITHLLYVPDFDASLINKQSRVGAYQNIKKVAAQTGKKLIKIATNVPEFTPPRSFWEMYHGSALASVGLILAPLFNKIYIAASAPYHQIQAWGTHPLLDPLWSTGNTSFIHDGNEIDRNDKVIDWICHSDLALQTLRVCFAHWGSFYNCGVCEKCLRTMIPLYIGVGLKRCPTFAQPLLPSNIKKLRLNHLYMLKFATDNMRLVKEDQSRLGRGLYRALKKAIGRGRRIVALRVMRGKNIK